MRKLIFAINTTLDGCIEHTKFSPDKEVMDYFTRLTQRADTFLYGRITYELMVPYWPDAAKEDSSDEFAQAFDAVEKIIVFSKSMGSVHQGKATLVRSGLRDEVLKLKQQDGKDIMTGGVNVASQLAALGLIDEYHFVIHPIVTGEGIRLFEAIDLQGNMQLKLTESTVFKSGVVVLRYIK